MVFLFVSVVTLSPCYTIMMNFEYAHPNSSYDIVISEMIMIIKQSYTIVTMFLILLYVGLLIVAHPSIIYYFLQSPMLMID